ncbi:MAG: cupin domain-containing protein [Gemmatimonadaceae bacterium]|nr:cupin domain-containing protein [Gemmatimonadaceae bacterium]
MRLFRPFLLLCALVMVAAPAYAQLGSDAATLIVAQKAAMAKIARFDGIWRGPGWTILANGTKHNITQTERIGPFLDGSVKVIEGRGYKADGRVVFNALGIISYDTFKKAYNLHSYAQGFSGDFPLNLTETGYTWSIPAGPATILYTVTITDSTWLEVGDRVMAGRPPVRFFEMNLKRVGSTMWPSADQVAPNDQAGTPLVLSENDGERRIRRFGGASSEFTIKVDGKNGGSPDFVMLYENMPPGASIPPHRHLLSDEILFVKSGTGSVEVGSLHANFGAGATIYIPKNTRITVRNTGKDALSVAAIFARPGFETYLRESSVLEGQPVIMLTPSEMAAIRQRNEMHTVYEKR